MFKKVAVFLSLFVFSFLFLPFSSVLATPSDFVQDEVIIKLKTEMTQELLDKLPPRGAKIFAKLLLPQTFILKVPQGQVAAFVRILSLNPLVEYAEPDYTVTAQDLIPNDPQFNLQWGLAGISAPGAWAVTTGSANIKIAVLDTGINLNHQDLINKIDPKMQDFTASGIEDNYGHGTHVSGITAAETNNGIGIAGIGYNSKIMVVKVLDNSGGGYTSWVANGIKWAADNGANVINLSLGSSFRSSTLENAVNYAWGKGVVLAAAAGNNGSSVKLYPAAYSKVISVAATDINDKKASFSSFGKWVSLAAPGVNIYSTFPNHSYTIGKNLNYDYGSGTSMATPFVSGAAALVWASGKCAPLNNTCVRNRLQSKADKITGTGKYWIYGRLNAFKAVN